jgi:hypothetical protein
VCIKWMKSPWNILVIWWMSKWKDLRLCGGINGDLRLLGCYTQFTGK